jgi:hypothetical protein
MDKKLKSKLKPELSTTTTGTMDRTAQEKPTIVGGGTEPVVSQNQFIQKAAQQADAEEAERLQAIETVAQQPESPTPNIPTGKILIGKQNAQEYATNLPGIQSVTSNINLRLLDKSGLPVPQSVASLKDTSGKVLSVARSDEQGNILYQKPMPQGHYIIDIQSEAQRFPRIELLIEDQNLPPIKITAI